MESTKTIAVGSPGRHTKKAQPVPWWKKGVIYQIYVRSFYDTNGDGIGDLPGVTVKLDYLKDLGVDGIWLSPVTASANADWGYDVVDYTAIDPVLGTMADFDKLLHEAHARGIKVLVDFVPNHTSTKHPWFQNALTGRDAKYRNYYIWADPKPWGRKPNNWKSWFGGSAWSYHRPTKQYYLHNFLPQQADLNWRNPDVQHEFDKIIRFWLDRGIDGFRIDVSNMLIKDRELRDNPKISKRDNIEVRVLGQRPRFNTTRPEVHQILRRWRKISDGYPEKRLLLGETTMIYTARQVAAFYGEQDELELAFNFNFLRAPFDARPLKRVVQETELALKSPDWPVWTASNHDERGRFPSRWGHGDERKIRCALIMLLGLKGTPVMYYGDEIGMTNVYVPPWRVQDPWGVRYWPVFSGRDRSRTPMQWVNAKGAGFTDEDVRPWLPYGHLQARNVNEQMEESDSTFHFTKDLIELRRSLPDLNLGGYQALPVSNGLWAWHRGQHTMVVLNLSNSKKSMKGLSGKILISTDRSKDGHKVTGRLSLDPWQGVIIKLS